MGGTPDWGRGELAKLKLGEAERRILAELAKTGEAPVVQESCPAR